MADANEKKSKFGPDPAGKNRYDNVPVPFFFKESSYDKFVDMDVKEDDIFINTFPKCGTNLVYRIVQGLLHVDEEGNSTVDFAEKFPMYPEGLPAERPAEPSFPFKRACLDDIYSVPSPRVFITHLPAHLFPTAIKQKGRYIYVTRNPKDAMTSLHFFRGEPKDGWEGTFKRFLDEDSPNAYGSYFTHMLEAQDMINDLGTDRSYVICFEPLKADIQGQLGLLADFLKIPITEAKAAKIEEISSFKKMKSEKTTAAEMLLRKGKTKDHLNYLTPDHWKRVEEVFQERLDGCAIAQKVEL